MPSPFAKDKRTNQYLDYTLENKIVRAVFDPGSLALISLYNKLEGKEYLNEALGANFRYVQEEGKPLKVAKIAALNKFLRIYYARVKEAISV